MGSVRQGQPVAVLARELVGSQAGVFVQRVVELLALRADDELHQVVRGRLVVGDDSVVPGVGAVLGAQVQDAGERGDPLFRAVFGPSDDDVVTCGVLPHSQGRPAGGAGVVTVGAGGLQVADDDVVQLQFRGGRGAEGAQQELVGVHAVLLALPYGNEEAVLVDQRTAGGVLLVVAEAVVGRPAQRLDVALNGLLDHAGLVAELHGFPQIRVRTEAVVLSESLEEPDWQIIPCFL